MVDLVDHVDFDDHANLVHDIAGPIGLVEDLVDLVDLVGLDDGGDFDGSPTESE